MEVALGRHGRTRTLRLAPDGDGFAATVDGAPHRVRLVATLARAAVAGSAVDEVVLEIDGRPYRAVIARQRDRVLAALGGDVFAFEIGDAGGPAGAGAAGSGIVTAPMPGKIVQVLVAARSWRAATFSSRSRPTRHRLHSGRIPPGSSRPRCDGARAGRTLATPVAIPCSPGWRLKRCAS
jgi:hypothetical protein